MARIEYRQTNSTSALNRVTGMPFQWSLNPYRGCVHACRYCYALPTHAFLKLDISDFSRIIFIKTDLPGVLASELSRRSWKREQVAVGTATDPYQPIEGRHRLTRRCLEIFGRYHTPVSLITKGTLAVRDIDVLQELTRGAGVTVCFSVPAVDRAIWRRTEPGTPAPEQRLRAMERLVAGGIRAGVLMAPLLPGLSATPEQIERTVRAAADHGARFVSSRLLNLGPDVREYFLGFLDREYPELVAGYDQLYGAKYAPKPYRETIDRRVHEARALFGYGDDQIESRETPEQPRQLSMQLLAG